MHVATYADDDVTVIDGLPVLSGARLVVDCAIALDAPDALAVADAALRRGLTDRDRLIAESVARSGHPGTVGVGLILDRAEPGAESWFESVSRWWLLEAGLPVPRLQVEFERAGRLARTDMYFEEFATVGEADGALKYAGVAGQSALVEEKRREEWLRDEFGVEVVRWMPRDMASPRGRRDVVTRIRAAFERRGSGARRGS